MTNPPKGDPNYDSAMELVRQIGDDGYFSAAKEALILECVRRQRGYSDPGGELAQRLRRGADAQRPIH